MQIKCTAEEIVRGEQVFFALKRKNYDDLRLSAESLLVPRILVVVGVPDSESEWLQQTEEEMSMRRCAYWMSLRDLPETGNPAGVTVRMPRSNLFDVVNLRGLMERAYRKEPL